MSEEQEEPQVDFDFSRFKPKSKEVVGPNGRKYLLVQATVGAVLAYRSALTKAGKINEKADGTVEIVMEEGGKGIAYVDFTLVSECLLMCDDEGRPMKNGDGFLPLGERLRAWDGRVIDPMVEWIKWASPELFASKEKAPDPKGLPSTAEGTSSSPANADNPLMK